MEEDVKLVVTEICGPRKECHGYVGIYWKTRLLKM